MLAKRGDPMKRIRIYLCAFLFVALSAIKLVSPAVAFDVRSAVQAQISRDDDYSAAENKLRDVWELGTGRREAKAGGLYSAMLPVQQMEQSRAAHTQHYFSDLPAAQIHPTPDAALEEQLQHAAAQDAAYAARETFLAAQAAFSDRAIPANVSYDIPELPFATVHPVSGRESSGFGYRMHPIQQTVKFHYGTDFAADSGTEICAFADGTVLAAGKDAGYGNYVKLDHGSGFVTLYGHCSSIDVSAGDTVAAGQTIARVGATGMATGPHLHFELIHEGVYLNPEFYLAI